MKTPRVRLPGGGAKKVNTSRTATKLKAGVTRNGRRAPLLANLETRRGLGDPAAVDDQLVVALRHDHGCGVDADGGA